MRTLSEIYHEETKYHEERMRKFQHQIDWSTQPLPYKSYVSENKIDLVPYLPLRVHPFTGVPLVPAEDDDPHSFGLNEISRLLYFTHGVTAILQYATGQMLHLRAAPTAGGLYPTEIYLATREMPSLADGIYNFQARDHTLVPAWGGNFWKSFESDCLGHEAVAASQLLIILTAVYQRSAWRYQERAYRRILLDTGHVLGNLLLYAPKAGFSPYPIGGFFDAAFNRLLFLDEADEGVLAVIALPRHDRVDPALIRQPSAFPSPQRYNVTSQSPLRLQLHKAGSIAPGDPDPLHLPDPGIDSSPLAARAEAGTEVSLPPPLRDVQEEIEQTILRRRSTRTFTGQAFIIDELATILDYAYRPDSSSPALLFVPSLVETYLVVQKVIGMEPGVYYFSPQQMTLKRLVAGDFRAQTWHFCLGQDLAKDAAVIVIHVAHLKTAVAQYGDRAYRYLHLDAGHIGQRLNLAAIKMELGVSGIGGFYDNEINALLGLSLDRIVLYVTTLGRPKPEA